jgi:hypothetical protein
MWTFAPVQVAADHLAPGFVAFFRDVAESFGKGTRGRDVPGIMKDVAKKAAHQPVREVAIEIAEKLEKGSWLSTAMSEHRVHFGSSIVACMKEAEGSWETFVNEIRRLGGLDPKESPSPGDKFAAALAAAVASSASAQDPGERRVTGQVTESASILASAVKDAKATLESTAQSSQDPNAPPGQPDCPTREET